MRYQEVEEPQEGDWALHKSGDLDERRVAKVMTNVIWIYIGEQVAGPFLKESYTYSRERANVT